MSTNGYLFTTRKQVLARLTPSSEPEFLISAVRLIAERNGWMASHRSRAAKLIAKLAEGAASTSDLAEAAELMKPYARTISRILREREIAEGSSELVAKAAVFGVVPTSPTSAISTGTASTPASVAAATAAEVPTVPTKRRPGRPKGSKNKKPRSESEPRRRRRS